MAQLRNNPANIKLVPSQPYFSRRKLVNGAKIKHPTPEPQTPIPKRKGRGLKLKSVFF